MPHLSYTAKRSSAHEFDIEIKNQTLEPIFLDLLEIIIPIGKNPVDLCESFDVEDTSITKIIIDNTVQLTLKQINFKTGELKIIKLTHAKVHDNSGAQKSTINFIETKGENIIDGSFPVDSFLTGTIQFYDHYIPSIDAGIQIIEVDADVNNRRSLTTEKIGEEEIYEKEITRQKFYVLGPRFSIDEADIHMRYPLQNSTGKFSHELPYIVLNKRTLPWERLISRNIPQKSSEPPPPWLALLTFSEEELEIPTNIPNGIKPSPTKAVTYRFEDWQSQKSNDNKIYKPKLAPEIDSDNGKSCQIIQINMSIFKNLAPYLSELKYLTHCRQINTDMRKDLVGVDPGFFSVVLSNRFPKTPPKQNNENNNRQTNIVHLISLEGLDKILPDEQKPLSVPTGSVQLLSLASWTFNCLNDDKESFTALMTAIVTEQKSLNPKEQFLRLPAEKGDDSAPEQAITNQYFELGYAPFLYKTRTAEKTLAWYRGPLTPVVVDELPSSSSTPLPTKTRDNVMIFDEVNHVFDLSYAAAWQLGRSLALHDTHFTQALLQLRIDIKTNIYKQLKTGPSGKLGFLQSAHKHDKSSLALKDSILHAFANSLSDHVNTISNLNFSQFAEPSLRKDTSTSSSNYESSKEKTLIEQHQEKQKNYNVLVNTLSPDDISIPINIVEWVKNLIHLKGIPAQYFIPDAQMLPPETIRFFYIDANWISKLIDGAFSIGLHCQQDESLNAKIIEKIKNACTYPISGFLLRSTVVSGWPGLLVKIDTQKDGSYKEPDTSECLAPGVLLVLLNTNPLCDIQIGQPHEQLSFGVDADNDRKIHLRDITTKVGEIIPNKDIAPSEYLCKSRVRVLNLSPCTKNGLLSLFETKLNPKNHKITPAEVATQLMTAPLAAQFNICVFNK